MIVDALASEVHYANHLAPVMAALPASMRGALVDPHHRLRASGRRWVGLPEPQAAPGDGEAVLVASYADFKRASKHYDRFILMQHGAGQSYSGGSDNEQPQYPGGDHQERVGLFLCPNEYSANRWRQRYPEATVEVIGSPAVERLPAREPEERTVAISFHWLCNLWPETRPAFGYYKPVLGYLAQHFRILGHGHPRAMRWLVPWYRKWGFEVVPDFTDVVRRASVYVCDNSSTIFEFAAKGGPVVLLNSPQYRRAVNHGGRFWDWASIGPQVNYPADLVENVRLALVDPPGLRAERERIVRQVYSQVEGSTEAAAEAIIRWAA